MLKDCKGIFKRWLIPNSGALFCCLVQWCYLLQQNHSNVCMYNLLRNRSIEEHNVGYWTSQTYNWLFFGRSGAATAQVREETTIHHVSFTARANANTQSLYVFIGAKLHPVPTVSDNRAIGSSTSSSASSPFSEPLTSIQISMFC